MKLAFEENAARGDSLAMAALHYCHEKGLGEDQPKPDLNKAYQWASIALDMDEPRGLGEFLMGRCHRFGIGTPKNLVAGIELYRKSAQQGFVLGEFASALVDMYRATSAYTVSRAAADLERMGELGMQHVYLEVPGGDHSLFISQNRELLDKMFAFFKVVSKTPESKD